MEVADVRRELLFLEPQSDLGWEFPVVNYIDKQDENLFILWPEHRIDRILIECYHFLIFSSRVYTCEDVFEQMANTPSDLKLFNRLPKSWYQYD